MAKGNNLIPTYKHLNRNLYLIPTFTKLNNDRLGKYIISETPWMPQKKCLASSQAKSELEIMVQHETKITLETMGQRYCFTQGKVVSMKEYYLNLTGTSEAEECKKQEQKITQFTIEQLSKQCGLTYRASENTLFKLGSDHPNICRYSSTIWGRARVALLVFLTPPSASSLRGQSYL